MIQLRPYQQSIVNEAKLLMQRGNRKLLICAPTGSGKTALTSHMLGSAASKGLASFFIVHRRELVRQSITAFSKSNISYGVCAAGFIPSPEATQICSIQTLRHRYTRLKRPSMIVWDEAHHISAGTWDYIYKLYPQAYHIGLTATPRRMDGTGLRPWFSEIIQGPSVSWLIDNGFLCDYRVYAPPSMHLDGIKISGGDYVRSQLAHRIDRPSITGDAVREYQKRAPGKLALAFCATVEHSKHVAEQFNAAGIPAEHVDGETDSYIRDRAMTRFANREIKVITSVDIFGEGVDIPALECVILMRPTKSLGLYLQQVGRVLRPSPGKELAIILDLASNTEQHGLPDAEREWDLDGGKARSGGASSVRTCPICYAAQAPGGLTCKYCGFLFIPEPREIDQIEGELVAQAAETEIIKQRQDRKAEWRACKSLEDFAAMGQRRGYSPAWASVQMKLKRSWGHV